MGRVGEGSEMMREPKSETPFGWFNIAHAFLLDAALLHLSPHRPHSGHYEKPVRFLYYQAIELFLKAFLRTAGVKDDEVRRYGHDLARLITEAEDRGMSLTAAVDDVRTIYLTGEQAMQTRYLQTGFRRRLPAERLHEAARDLQVIVENGLRSSDVRMKPLPPIPDVRQ